MPKKNEIVVTGKAVTYKAPLPAGGVQLETFVPYTLIKRGVKREIITPIDAPEQFQQEAIVAREKRKATKETALVKALGLAHYWQSLLDSGKFKTLTEIAAAEGMDLARVSRIIGLSRLAPEVTAACVGKAEKTWALKHFSKKKILLSWELQREQLE